MWVLEWLNSGRIATTQGKNKPENQSTTNPVLWKRGEVVKGALRWGAGEAEQMPVPAADPNHYQDLFLL